jgi:hypothetical protein
VAALNAQLALGAVSSREILNPTVRSIAFSFSLREKEKG